jgi:general secretion pathway protein K
VATVGREILIRGERGVALITVLFIISLSTMLVVFLITRQQVDIQRTANVIDSDQALLLAEAMTDWGRQVLDKDRKEGKSDSLGEEWATVLSPAEVDGGLVTGSMEDMQGRFNLNNTASMDASFRDYSREQFGRLLEMCGLEAELRDAVSDWLDVDSDILVPGGAEDEAYLSQSPPYRTSNGKMTSPSELRLVAGFDAKAYTCLSPYICTLPEDSYINVNTASDFVLASLSDDFSLEAARLAMEDRPASGYATVAEFIKEPVLAGIGLIVPYLSVSSSYFMAYAEARINGSRVKLNTLLARNFTGVEIVGRSIGTY